MRIRRATDRDRGCIAALQVASWQGAYTGLLPADFLEYDVPRRLNSLWRSRDLDQWATCIADRSGCAIGFACVGIRDDGVAYLDNLHVRADHARQGIGRALMESVFSYCAAQGADSLELTVLDGNDAGLAFYAHIGGEVGEPVVDDLLGRPVNATVVRWHGLTGGSDKDMSI